MQINRDFVELSVLSIELNQPFRFASHHGGWARVWLGECYIDFRSNNKNAGYIERSAALARRSTHVGVAMKELVKEVSWKYE